VTEQRVLDWSVDAAAVDRARVLKGWTRRDLAQRAHVDEGTLCDLFAGRRRPTFGTLRAVCHALELSFGDVIEFADVALKPRDALRYPTLGLPAVSPSAHPPSADQPDRDVDRPNGRDESRRHD
jgi:transcriptional regulator with XRE-family HTH domain